jgi:hypothetical protein
MRQMGLGLMMYTQDYDEQYPAGNISIAQTPPDGFNWTSGTTWLWPQTIYPYTKNSEIYLCPTSTQHPRDAQGRPQPTYYNYGANYLMLRDGRYFPGGPNEGDSGVAFSPVKMASINEPARIYVIMDSYNYRTLPDRVITPNSGWGWLPGSGSVGFALLYDFAHCRLQFKRHFGGVNITFADGHSKWLKSSAVLSEARKCVAGSNCAWFYNTPPTASSAWNPYSN